MDGNLARHAQPPPTPGPSRRGPGVRVHLVVLALLALLPAWGLAGFAALRFAEVERARLLRIAQDAARDIATGVEREAAALRAGLAAAATSPALTVGDLAAFERQMTVVYGGPALALALEPRPGPDGGPDAPVAMPRLEWNAEGRPVVLFRQPLGRGAGAASGDLVLRTDPVLVWSAILQRARLPDGWVASVLDADNAILARFPEPARFVGHPVHPDALAVLQGAPEDAPAGWGSGSTREGDPVRIAWRRVGGLPWRVLVGVPRDAVDGALHRALLPVLVGGVPVLLGLTLGTAFWASRRIAGPLRGLEATAEAVGRRAVPAPPPPSGVREIDAAGVALVAAARRLREHEGENARLAARLEAVLESTTDCVVVLDRALTPIYLNGRARALLGHGQVGSWDGLPIGRGTAFAEGFERAFRSGAPVSVTARVRPGGAPDAAARWFAADAFPSAQGLTVFFRDVTAARLAEQALRDSEARLQAVLDHVPLGVMLAEAPSGRVVLANRRLAEILGLPSVRVRAVRDYGAFPAFDAEGAPVPAERRAIMRALAGEAQVRGEYRFRRRDGSFVWVRVLAAPIRDAQGRVTGAVAAVADIEAEREAEAALRESELRFRVLAEAVPQIVWSCGADGRIDYLNPHFFAFTGAAPAEPAALGALPIHPEDREATGRAWREALATGSPYEAEYRLRRADGQWRWFVGRALPLHGSGAGAGRWIGTATDVTELIETRQALEAQVAAEGAARREAVKAAEALAASELRFRGFAEASPDLLWMLEPGTDRLAYLSPAYEQLWGEAPPEPPRLGDLLRACEPEDAAMVAALPPQILAGAAVQAEYRIRSADGQLRWIRLTSFAIDGAGGSGGAAVPRVGGFARDITRRREADTRQRMLIGELNHRVKNTLATVLSLARQTERSARRAGEAAETGSAESSFVSDFQARLLALARAHDLLTASTWRGAMLHEVVAAALSPWQADRDAGTRILVRGPAIWLAPRQALGLSLAIHEMATNAVKHGALRSPEGRLAFTWQRDATGEVEARWVESDGPPVRPPARSGFGTRLLRAGLATELGPGSEIRLDYPPEGFQATMRFRPLRDGDET